MALSEARAGVEPLRDLETQSSWGWDTKDREWDLQSRGPGGDPGIRPGTKSARLLWRRGC